MFRTIRLYDPCGIPADAWAEQLGQMARVSPPPFSERESVLLPFDGVVAVPQHVKRAAGRKAVRGLLQSALRRRKAAILNT